MSFNNTTYSRRLDTVSTMTWSVHQPRLLNYNAPAFVSNHPQATLIRRQEQQHRHATPPGLSLYYSSPMYLQLGIFLDPEVMKIMGEIHDLLRNIKEPQWWLGSNPLPILDSVKASESIFCGGLHDEHIDTTLLYLIGSRFGTVRMIEWNPAQGSAFIHFENTTQARHALYFLQGLSIYSSNLRTSWDTRSSIWIFGGVKTYYWNGLEFKSLVNVKCFTVYLVNPDAINTPDNEGQMVEGEITEHQSEHLEHLSSPAYDHYTIAVDVPSPYNRTIGGRPLTASPSSSSSASQTVLTPPTPSYIELPLQNIPPIGSEMSSSIKARRQFWDQQDGHA